jgi:hypothetical protein
MAQKAAVKGEVYRVLNPMFKVNPIIKKPDVELPTAFSPSSGRSPVWKRSQYHWESNQATPADRRVVELRKPQISMACCSTPPKASVKLHFALIDNPVRTLDTNGSRMPRSRYDEHRPFQLGYARRTRDSRAHIAFHRQRQT